MPRITLARPLSRRRIKAVQAKGGLPRVLVPRERGPAGLSHTSTSSAPPKGRLTLSKAKVQCLAELVSRLLHIIRRLRLTLCL